MTLEDEPKKIDLFEAKTSRRVKNEIGKLGVENENQSLPIGIEPERNELPIIAEGLNRQEKLEIIREHARTFSQPIISALTEMGIDPQVTRINLLTGSVFTELSVDQIRQIVNLDQVSMVQWNGLDHVAINDQSVKQ